MDASPQPQRQEQCQHQEADHRYHRNGDKHDILQAFQGLLCVLVVVVIACERTVLPYYAWNFLYLIHNALKLIRIIHIKIPILYTGSVFDSIEQEGGCGRVCKYNNVVE